MQKKLFILFLLLYCVVCYSAETTYFVDVDVIGGDGQGGDLDNAYSSLNIAENARDADITAGDAVRFLCHNTLGGTDTATVNFLGWTTDADSYIKVEVASAYRHSRVWDASKYNMAATDTHIIETNENFVRIDGIQLKVTITGNGSCLYVDTAEASNDIRFSNLILWGDCTGTGGGDGIQVGDSNATVSGWNIVCYGFKSVSTPGDNGFNGLYSLSSTTVNWWNCTVNDCKNGIRHTAGTVSATNCLVFENLDDFRGTVTVTYCASDDNDVAGAGNFQITQTGDDYAALVVDADERDYNVTDGSSELVGAGIDDPGDPIQDHTDIALTARSSTWDIGAFELEGVAPPTGGQVIMIQMSMIPLFLIFTLVCFIRGKEIGK